MKLSKKLIEILELMNNGWELGRDHHMCRWWLQKGGLGYGGDAIRLHGRTKVRMLLSEGLIEDDGKHHFPTTPYYLTDKGEEYLKELK